MNFRVVHLDMKSYEKLPEIDEGMAKRGFQTHRNLGTGRVFRLGISSYLVVEEELSDAAILVKAQSVLTELDVKNASVSIMPEEDYARDRAFFIGKAGEYVRDNCGMEILKALFVDMAQSEMEVKALLNSEKPLQKDKWGVIRVGFENKADVILDMGLMHRSLICRGFGPYSPFQRLPTIPENCFLVRHNSSEKNRTLQKIENDLKKYLKKKTGKVNLRIWDELRACPRIASELAERIESDVSFLNYHRLLHSTTEDSIRILTADARAKTLAELPEGAALARRIDYFWERCSERPLTVVAFSLASTPAATVSSSTLRCDAVMRADGFVPLLSSPGAIYLKERPTGSVVAEEIQALSAKAGCDDNVFFWDDFRSYFDFYQKEIHGKGKKGVWNGPEDYANPVRERLKLVSPLLTEA